jgi:hypothetical protein
VQFFVLGYIAIGDNLLSWGMVGCKTIQLIVLSLKLPMDDMHEGCCPIYELVNIKWVLRCQEINISGNKSTISTIVDQVQTQEENRDGEISLLMEIVQQQKQKIVKLQTECATLKHMVTNMVSIHNMAYSMAQLSVGYSSNKEGETIQQHLIYVEMEFVEQNLVSTELKLN